MRGEKADVYIRVGSGGKENYRHYAELLKIACVDYIHIDIFKAVFRFH